MAHLKLPDSQTPLPTIKNLILQSFVLSHLINTEIGCHLNLRAPFMNFDIDTLGNLKVLLEIVLSTFDYLPGKTIESSLFPFELSCREIEIFPPLINWWIHNELETPFMENRLHYEHRLGQGEVHSTLPDSAFSSHHLVIPRERPIDLERTDPESLTVTKWFNPVSITIYGENDVNGDQQQDDLILIPYGKPNEAYRVRVLAESGASPNDIYTLQAAYGDTIVLLAQNTLISNIPGTPYAIDLLYTGFKVTPDDNIFPLRLPCIKIIPILLTW